MARILVVDDRPDVARAIARMLFNHEAATETDARVAVDRLIAGDPFDIVLLDYDMPEMSGREASDAIAAAALTRPPIVLIMSGGENVTSLFETGRAVLIKPFNGSELRDLVSGLLHHPPAPDPLEPRASA
ncbi:MAG TPA: response regulator [Kofleriaceae bacterium]|nr:response regulator [Kofleriaceae bacterium]